ncbi:MAG: lipopolysaccharide biosynthesis protein [Candidatus Helarchaeota archaeon]
MENKEKNGLNKKSYLIKSSLTLSITQIVLTIIGFFSIWVSGNFINSFEMGIISIFTMFYTLTNLISLNLPDGIMRYLSLYIGENNQEKIQKVINLAFIVYISFIILLNIIIPILMITILNYLSISYSFLQFFIIILAVNFLHLFSYLKIMATAFKHYNKIAIISFVCNSSGTIFSIFFIILGYPVTGFTTRWVLINFIGLIILLIVIIKYRIPFMIKTEKGFYSFREILTFSLPSFVNSFIQTIILTFFVKLSISFYFGMDILGYYEFGLKFISIFISLMIGFNQIIMIHFTHEYGERGMDGIKENLTWTLRVTSFILIFLTYFTLIFGYSLFSCFLPIFIPSLFFLYGILIFQVTSLIYYPFTNLLFAIGKNWQIFSAYLVGYSGLFTVFLFLPYFNIMGIVIGFAVYHLLYLITLLSISKRYLKIKVYILIPIKFFLITSPILIIGALLNLFLNLFYFIPINFGIIFLSFMLTIRFGKLITESDIDRGFTFLPNSIRKLIKKLFISKLHY